MFRFLVLAVLALPVAQVFAKTDPCHTRSRQLTLAKNCYSGDMGKSQGGSPRFFTTTSGKTPNVNYCYNSLIEIDHKPGQAQMRIRVLKESKDGQYHAYQFTLSPNDLGKGKKDISLFSLKGLKGDCFSPTGDKEACNGGLLKAIGLKDMNAPMIVGVGRSGNSYTVTHLTSDAKEIEAHPPKVLEGVVLPDAAPIVSKLVQEVHHKLSTQAAAKMAAIHAGKTSPKKMSESSEQFRYCSMAFEGYIASQKLTNPFTPQEKTALNNLINYMNNDPHFETISRLPATSTPVVGKSKK
jgi:hypothetical protein